MKKKLFYWLSLVLLLFLAACGQTKKEAVTFKNEVTQTIASGQVKGKQDQENGVLEWLGVPYAAAPVGDLRWKEPQTVKAWRKTFDATKAGEKFVQFSNGEVVGSEGDLNLDLVRPDTTEAVLSSCMGETTRQATPKKSREIPLSRMLMRSMCLSITV